MSHLSESSGDEQYEDIGAPRSTLNSDDELQELRKQHDAYTRQAVEICPELRRLRERVKEIERLQSEEAARQNMAQDAAYRLNPYAPPGYYSACWPIPYSNTALDNEWEKLEQRMEELKELREEALECARAAKARIEALEKAATVAKADNRGMIDAKRAQSSQKNVVEERDMRDADRLHHEELALKDAEIADLRSKLDKMEKERKLGDKRFADLTTASGASSRAHADTMHNMLFFTHLAVCILALILKHFDIEHHWFYSVAPVSIVTMVVAIWFQYKNNRECNEVEAVFDELEEHAEARDKTTAVRPNRYQSEITVRKSKKTGRFGFSLIGTSVSFVEEGSSAEKKEMEEGNKIIAINGVHVGTMNDDDVEKILADADKVKIIIGIDEDLLSYRERSEEVMKELMF